MSLQIASGKEKNDEEMRKLIYSMLAPEGGEHVQKVIIMLKNSCSVACKTSGSLVYCM